MGKNLIQQRRGRAKGRYHKPGHKCRGEVKYSNKKSWEGTMDDILHSNNEDLNGLVFASEMAKKVKEQYNG